MSKIILVTGTSTGLGLSLAIKLAEQGNTVYATMRNLSRICNQIALTFSK